MASPQYLLAVNHVVGNLVKAVDILRQRPDLSGLRTVLITNQSDAYEKYAKFINQEDIVICDFNNQEDIKEKLLPLNKNIVGVVCRGEKNIQYLRKLAPFLPKDIAVASPESLAKATNKRLMRVAFSKQSPEITPSFLQVSNLLPETISAVEKALGYPMIIKPANLFSSLLIQVCRNRTDLETGLEAAFQKINRLYDESDIYEEPQIIVEEYLEGDFYSIDAYAMSGGTVFFDPPVAYVPATQIGINDFFLYKRFIPTKLSDQEIDDANRTVAKALKAIDLTNSSAHVELVLTKDGWKIIEIGPRLGRFRHIMYGLAYGINHSMNDLKIHLGIEPDIPTKLLNYCAAYSIYPTTKEGILKEVTGIKTLEKYPELEFLRHGLEPGDKSLHAKNGGVAIVEFVVASNDQKQFAKRIEFIEKNVNPVID